MRFGAGEQTRAAQLAWALVLAASSPACAPSRTHTTTTSTVTMPPADVAASEGADATAPAPTRAASTQPCDRESMPPIDLVVDNIAATELSGIAEIESAEVTGTDGSRPAPTTGYVHLRYRVSVIAQFSGPRREQLRLTQGAEAGFKPRDVGSLLFFSGCADGSDGVYEPDVGYFFPLEPGCVSQLEDIAAPAVRDAGSKTATACEK